MTLYKHMLILKQGCCLNKIRGLFNNFTWRFVMRRRLLAFFIFIARRCLVTREHAIITTLVRRYGQLLHRLVASTQVYIRMVLERSTQRIYVLTIGLLRPTLQRTSSYRPIHCRQTIYFIQVVELGHSSTKSLLH